MFCVPSSGITTIVEWFEHQVVFAHRVKVKHLKTWALTCTRKFWLWNGKRPKRGKKYGSASEGSFVCKVFWPSTTACWLVLLGGIMMKACWHLPCIVAWWRSMAHREQLGFPLLTSSLPTLRSESGTEGCFQFCVTTLLRLESDAVSTHH